MKLRIKSPREKCVPLLAVWRMGVEMWFTDMAVGLLAPAVERERPCVFCVFSCTACWGAAQHSVVLCFVVQRGRDMGPIPSLFLHSLLRKAYTPDQTLFYLLLLLLVQSLLLIYPSTHLSSINLRCLSDPERSHCAWLKRLPGHCTSNYSRREALHFPPFSVSVCACHMI